MTLLLALLACHKDPDPAPPESRPDSTLTLELSAEDGLDGPVVLDFNDGTQTLRFTVNMGQSTLELPEGRYGLTAFRDDDGDGARDGVWADRPEPAALLGLSVPRDTLRLPLRASLPEPILSEDPEWVALYDAAWAMARDHIGRGNAQNGLADAYMDEAFSPQLFQWDTCFMTLFGQQGLDSFPVMPSLDNFYGTQAADGYICRVVNESDGAPGGDASDPSEPMINPPLFAHAELAYARRSGDLSRLPRVLPILDAYADWLDANVRTGAGLYYTSLLGSGIDNAPPGRRV